MTIENEEVSDNVIAFEQNRAKKYGPTLLGADFNDEADANEAREIMEAEDELLKKMNLKHAFITGGGPLPRVLSEIYNPITDQVGYELKTVESIHVTYSNQTAVSGDKVMELGRWWIKHIGRREYSQIFFDPGLPTEYKNCFNLWRGIRYPAVAGVWKKTRKHIWDILCNKDPVKFKYVIRWFAWMIQNPDKRAEVALVFKGKQGSGKGIILNQFIKILGENGMQVTNIKHLTGQFNIHLAKSVYLYADEAYNPGDRQSEGIIKSLITEPTIATEGKFMNMQISKNCLHVVMSSNEDWVVPITADSRRFFINETDNKWTRDNSTDADRETYFNALNKEIASGGTEAMHYFLQNIDLKDWHPRSAVPKTEEMERQKTVSLSHTHKALYYMLMDGIFPGVISEHGEYLVTPQVLRDYIGDCFPELKNVKKLSFDTATDDLGIRVIKHKSVGMNSYLFPPLAQLRNAWKRKNFPGVFDEPNTWRLRGKQTDF